LEKKPQRPPWKEKKPARRKRKEEKNEKTCKAQGNPPLKTTKTTETKNKTKRGYISHFHIFP
jgi:hypothetical protein